MKENDKLLCVCLCVCVRARARARAPKFLTELKFNFMHHLLKMTFQVTSIATSANILPFYLAEANTRYSKSLGMTLVHC